MLHHVGMSWIIISNKEMDYEINTESNHLDWLNKGSWYNRNICSKLRGIRFEYFFMTQARTEKYNIMCSLVAHYRLQPDYEDDESIIGDRAILGFPAQFLEKFKNQPKITKLGIIVELTV